MKVKKVPIPQGEENFILCRTAGRKEKEKAIRNRFSARMEEVLQRLAKTIQAGRLNLDSEVELKGIQQASDKNGGWPKKTGTFASQEKRSLCYRMSG